MPTDYVWGTSLSFPMCIGGFYTTLSFPNVTSLFFFFFEGPVASRERQRMTAPALGSPNSFGNLALTVMARLGGRRG